MTRRFFYGWVVLAAAFVIITMALGTLFTLGVLLKPIEDSVGWSRSGIGAGTYQGLFVASAAIGAMAIVLGTTLRPPEALRAPRPSPAAGG
jgi:hypothetical protein